MGYRVLHLIKRSVLDPNFQFLGSTKDILGRREYFASRGIESVEFCPKKGHSDIKFMNAFKTKEFRKLVGDLSRFDAAVFEYPRFVEAFEFLRRESPRMKMIVRSHNAELLHRLDRVISTYAMNPIDLFSRKDREQLVAEVQTQWQQGKWDLQSGPKADKVLAICDWEARYYWPFIVPRKKIACVPYFLPKACDKHVPSQLGVRERRCVALTSSDPGPLVFEAARAFARLVARSPQLKGEWRFQMTGEIPEAVAASDTGIERLGNVENPLEILRNASCTALLSSRGMGFKTKILDAARMGCYTLVPWVLYNRIPKEVQPFCLVVDPNSPSSFARALERSMTPSPACDPNDQLRQRAFSALDEVFRI